MRAKVALSTFTQANFQWLKMSEKLHAMRLREQKASIFKFSMQMQMQILAFIQVQMCKNIY